MPPSLFAVFAVQAYVSAEAYAQAQSGSLSAASSAASEPSSHLPPPSPPPLRDDFQSVFFRNSPPFVPSLFTYRNPPEPQFQGVTLPRDVVLHLFSGASQTGKRYSVFRHENGFDPVTYEVREGSSRRTHASALGSEVYSQAEEDFFGTDFAAHIHPPSQSYLPSQTDLEFMVRRARSNPERRFRHYVFGFSGMEAVFIRLETCWWPDENRLEFRCRTSENVPPEVSRLLQACVERI